MNATLTPQAFAKQFDEDHGGRDAAVFYRSVFWWADGSWRDADPRGVTAPASAMNEADRAKNVVMYHEVRYAAAAEKAKELRQLLLHVSYPKPDQLRELERLAAHARTCGAELEAAREKYAKHLPGYRSKADRQAEQEQASKLAEFHQRVKSIEF